jgi:hypothetical protein
MEAAIAIGGLILLVGLGGWVAISEAKSGAVTGEALKAAREVIDGLDRFNKARRASAGLPRIERLALMLQELRAGSRPTLPEDE